MLIDESAVIILNFLYRLVNAQTMHIKILGLFVSFQSILDSASSVFWSRKSILEFEL